MECEDWLMAGRLLEWSWEGASTLSALWLLKHEMFYLKVEFKSRCQYKRWGDLALLVKILLCQSIFWQCRVPMLDQFSRHWCCFHHLLIWVSIKVDQLNPSITHLSPFENFWSRIFVVHWRVAKTKQKTLVATASVVHSKCHRMCYFSLRYLNIIQKNVLKFCKRMSDFL